MIDKWSKAKIALKCGIDLVLELPTLYSISSAENFSQGAVRILNSLNIIDYLAFGSETNDINKLNNLAEILYDEPEEYKNILSKKLDEGISFPKAREIALLEYLHNDNNYINIISTPNNILAIEYLKALKKYNSNIMPIAIPRYKVGHNDLAFSNNISSATFIRNMIKNNKINNVKNFVPKESFSIIDENIKLGHVIFSLSQFEKQIIYMLRRMTVNEISNLPDVSEGLEFNIKNNANLTNNIHELINNIKSKRYTSTRLQRIMLYALLNITKDDINISKTTLPYIRILGCNSNGKLLLSKISKSNPKLNVVTSVKGFYDKISDDNLKLIFDKDILSSNIYTIGYTGTSFGNLDFSNGMIIL